MPNYIDLFPNNYTVSSDVNNTLSVNPLAFVGDSPFPLDLVNLAEDSINAFLTTLGDVTGINLTGSFTSLTTIFGDLNPTSFNPLGAVETFLQLIISLGGEIASSIISGFGSLFGAGGVIQTLINDLVGLGTTLTGATGLQSILTDLLSVLGTPIGLGTGSPSLGILGGDLITGVQSFTDSIFQGVTGLFTTGNSFANVANALGTNANTLNNTETSALNSANYVATMAINAPGYHAVDPSLSGVFPLTNNTGTTPQTIPVNAAYSAIGMIQIPAAATKATAVWQGYGNTNLSAAYVNLYSVNTANGALTKVYASGNIVSYIGNTLVNGQIPWIYVPITSFPVAQNTWYAAELALVGTGTHTMVGMPNHYLAPNPNVYPPQLGATRATGIALDAAAYDSTLSGFGATSGNHTHTIAAGVGSGGAIYAIINADTSATATCEVGSTSMTQLGSALAIPTSSPSGYLFVFVLYNPPTGAQTISWTSGSNSYTTCVSASFFGVTSTGTITTTVATTGTAMTQSATASVGQLILQAFAYVSNSSTITAYNQITALYRVGQSNNNNPILVGYAAGTGSSTSFSATGSVSDPWLGFALPLNGPSVAAPSTIAAPGATPSANVPWLALSSVATGTTAGNQTQSTPFPTGGIYTAPLWALHIDLVGVGGGGSGEGEIGFNMGQGGGCGIWNGITLAAGTDYTPGTTVFTVTPGAGGAGIIGYFSNGNSGANTTITWTDPSSNPRTFTCLGGAGGQPGFFGYGGVSAANYMFDSIPYYGGAGGFPGVGGSPPGGGGGGAVIFQPFSGAGANGEAWCVAHPT